MFVLQPSNLEKTLSCSSFEPGLSSIEAIITENHEFEDQFGRFVLRISEFIVKFQEIVLPAVICNARRNEHLLFVTCSETS